MDLIYLDPPFNSSATYNVLVAATLRSPRVGLKPDATGTGEESAAQITAFEDTWQWSKDAEAVYREIVESGPGVLKTRKPCPGRAALAVSPRSKKLMAGRG